MHQILAWRRRTMGRSHSCLLLAVILLSYSTLDSVVAADSPVLHSEFIYETAPFPSCHASTIVETSGGLVTAWFGGTREKHPDVGIWISRHEEGKWTTPVEVANGLQVDGTRHPTWNPVLFQPQQGPLMLFFKVGPDPRTWWGMVMTSQDEGKSWSVPNRLPEGILGPIKNKPIQLANGDILSPSSTESLSLEGENRKESWRIHFERTTDLGKNWSVVTPVEANGIDAIQPSLLFMGGDRLLSLGRTRRGNQRLFRVESLDGGLSWGAMTYLPLPNPNSGTDAVTLKDGRHCLIYNHTKEGRSPLNLAISDDGQKWMAAWELENTPGQEFSYPAIIQTRDGLLHMTYTWHREKIKHVTIDPSQLHPQPIVDGEWPLLP